MYKNSIKDEFLYYSVCSGVLLDCFSDMKGHHTTPSRWFCPTPSLIDLIKLETHICIHVMSWHSKSCPRIHLKTLRTGSFAFPCM